MFITNPFKRKKPASNHFGQKIAGKSACAGLLLNQLEIRIENILVKIMRFSTEKPANELTAVIPRAEIRRRSYENGKLTGEEEIILSSITLVDAPRHPAEERGSTGRPGPPRPAAADTPAPPR